MSEQPSMRGSAGKTLDRETVAADIPAAERDSRPMTAGELRRARRVPRVKTLRQAMKLTQEQFAERYMIPVATLRDWEQGATEPDAAGRAYIRAIIGDAEGVARALRAIPPPPDAMA